jgi:membrane-associated phospholipid phosphatase
VNHGETVASVLLPVTGSTPASKIPADLWLYPASVPVSVLAFGYCLFVVARRGSRRGAVAWAAAFVAGNVAELIGKQFVDRPKLFMIWHGVRTHVTGFDSSFPSGHTLRALVVVAIVSLLWPRLRAAAWTWAAVSLVLLVVTNAHTPSDVIGGALLAATLVSVACCVAGVPLGGTAANRPPR